MEQTKRRWTLKVVLAVVFAFAMALALAFGIVPETTLTAYATNSTVTIDFTSKDFSNGQKVTSVEQDDITVAFSQGAHPNTPPKYYTSGTASISDLQEWFGDGDSVFICTAAAPAEPASETYTLEIMDSGFEPTYIRNFKLGETVTAHVDKWDGCTPGTPTTEDDNITDLSIDTASDSYIVTFKVTGVVASGGAMIMVPFNSIGGGSAGGKAVWVRFVTFITFEPNGGKFVYELPDDTTEEITVSVTMPCDLNSKLDSFGLVLDGYQFLGWFNASEGGEQKTAATADLDGTTLYAHWEEESGGNGEEPINFHTHDYATEWSKDENTHWHACTAEGDCDAPKADEATHTYGDDISATAYYTCSVCGYENGTRKTEYEENKTPAHIHNDVIFTKWTSANSLPTAAGNYYLTQDVTIGSSWNVPTGTTNLCLNSFGIKVTGADSVVYVASGRTLNVYDCGETIHYFDVYSNGEERYAININETEGSGRHSFVGGYITGGQGKDNKKHGGGIYVSGGTCNLYGGNVIGNTVKSSDNCGAGVFLQESATFRMYGGSISYNYAQNAACAIFAWKNSTVEIRGGEISYNKTAWSHGSAISFYNPNGYTVSLKLYGGFIHDNLTKSSGGAVNLTATGLTVGLKGNLIVRDNATVSTDRNATLNVHVGSKPINIEGALTNTEKIGLRLSSGTGVFTSGWSTYMSGKDPADYFYSENPAYQVYLLDGEAAILAEAPHTHDYATEWSSDGSTHWHACKNEGCNAPKADEAIHTYGDDITATAYYTCSVCGYENGTRKTEYENAQQGGSGGVEPVLYLDENGETQICTDYTVINDDTTDLTEGWYVVTSDVTSVDRISVRGDVKIIICDGKTLTNYYYINCWYYEIDSLTVYVQSTGENMGSLVVDNSAGDPSFTAIDVINVIINGGNIIAKGNSGIEAGELTINGGNVTAIALNEYSQGIRAENAVVTNGKVFATGQFGINGPITIYGGEVYAEGTVYGLYIFSRGEAKAPVQGDISINGGFVTAVGNIQAVSGTVKNAVPGTGWTNTDGTEGQTAIDVNNEGRDFSETGYRKVQFLAVTHTHAFSYSANGATITATCGNVDCDITEGLALTLVAPTGNMVYDGKVRVATIAEGYSDVAFPNASIVYYKDNAVVDSCVEIGTYTAKVTFDGATAEVTFTIENWTMDDPEDEEVTLVINGAEFDEDVQLKVEVKAEIATDETQGDYTEAVKEKIAKNEKVAIVYEVKLMRITIVGGQETLEEIQPSDIKEGTTLTISMKIPENLKGKNFRILHIHNAGDVSVVDYTVSENGEYITVETDRLSEFAFLIEVSQVSKHGFCIGWIAFILACLALVFFLVWLLLGKKELLKLIGLIASCAVLVFAIIVIIVHTCVVSIIALILAIIAVALFALFFFLFKDKNEEIKNEISAMLATDEKGEKKETESFDEANDGIGLKESLAMAATATRSEKITKAYVRAYLTKNYPDSVEVNARENFTKTGLPLADTHYVKTEDNKTCFIYVYETEGATMLLLKTKDELGEELAKDYKTVRKSAFPKAKDKWYSVVIDDSLSNEQVEDMIDKTIALYAGATIPKKPVKSLTKVKKVTVAEASALIKDEVAATYIEVDKNAGSHIGKKDIVNVDTLSDNFNDGDTVTIDALKEKKLVPAKSKQVKLLARGSLDKKLFIELQDYSIEAVKMVIATGGTVKKV